MVYSLTGSSLFSSFPSNPWFAGDSVTLCGVVKHTITNTTCRKITVYHAIIVTFMYFELSRGKTFSKNFTGLIITTLYPIWRVNWRAGKVPAVCAACLVCFHSHEEHCLK